jgi:hypothetical protein
VDCEPLTALLPDQAPEAAHEAAFVADQVSVELVPLATVLGLAPSLTEGAGGATETVTDCAAFPPRPAQVNVKVESAISGVVVCVPLTFLVPDQAPEAAQVVVLLLVQVRVEVLAVLIVLGLAVSVTAGSNVVTVTVADWVAEPPGPEQVRSYSVLFVRLPVDQVPLVVTAPLQPPLAVHAVALVAFHVKVELPRALTVDGDAVNVTVGACPVTLTSADCAAEPPVPVHVSVKLVVDVRGSVVRVPLVGWEPLHPPDAAQLCALVTFHCKVVG